MQWYDAQRSKKCPSCGYRTTEFKNTRVFGSARTSVELSTLEATTYELSDKEFDGILRDELKRYLQEKLGAVKITNWDKTKDTKPVRLEVSKLIIAPEFASVAAAYVSLRSQEQQANLNLRLQWLIALVAIGTFFTGLLVVVLPYLHPH
jgi:hypothetical protein